MTHTPFDIHTRDGTVIRIREATSADAAAISDTLAHGVGVSLAALPHSEDGKDWVGELVADIKARRVLEYQSILHRMAQGIGRRKIFVAETTEGRFAGYSQIDIRTDDTGETYGQMEAWHLRREFFSANIEYTGRSLSSSLMDLSKRYAVGSGARRVESNTTKGLSSEAAHLRQGYILRPGLHPTPTPWRDKGCSDGVGEQVMLVWYAPES